MLCCWAAFRKQENACTVLQVRIISSLLLLLLLSYFYVRPQVTYCILRARAGQRSKYLTSSLKLARRFLTNCLPTFSFPLYWNTSWSAAWETTSEVWHYTRHTEPACVRAWTRSAQEHLKSDRNLWTRIFFLMFAHVQSARSHIFVESQHIGQN